jgi:hypothetical protein
LQLMVTGSLIWPAACIGVKLFASFSRKAYSSTLSAQTYLVFSRLVLHNNMFVQLIISMQYIFLDCISSIGTAVMKIWKLFLFNHLKVCGQKHPNSAHICLCIVHITGGFCDKPLQPLEAKNSFSRFCNSYCSFVRFQCKFCS